MWIVLSNERDSLEEDIENFCMSVEYGMILIILYGTKWSMCLNTMNIVCYSKCLFVQSQKDILMAKFEHTNWNELLAVRILEIARRHIFFMQVACKKLRLRL